MEDKKQDASSEGQPSHADPASGSSSLRNAAALNLPRYYYDVAPRSRSPPPMSPNDIQITKRRKELFGDCALIEIIHLHDCLRGALKSLQEDVTALTQQIIQDFAISTNNSSNRSINNSTQDGETRRIRSSQIKGEIKDDEQNAAKPQTNQDWRDLERSVAGRFKVIWSVFRAHSSAEDEFIWPALRSKMEPQTSSTVSNTCPLPAQTQSSARPGNNSDKNSPINTPSSGCGATTNGLVQEEYEEDHADEERMFSEMDALLTELRDVINNSAHIRSNTSQNQQSSPPTLIPRETSSLSEATQRKDRSSNERPETDDDANIVAYKIRESTRILSDHLMHHLEKEETQCMPLVVEHLSKTEICDLVGDIMGRRSADTIAQIMTMAVQSLPENERQEMIRYMKQSMQNTFFDRWLSASGFGQLKSNDETASHNGPTPPTTESDEDTKPSSTKSNGTAYDEENSNKRLGADQAEVPDSKRTRTSESNVARLSTPMLDIVQNSAAAQGTQLMACRTVACRRSVEITSQAELEKLIRAIATNSALTPQQKNATIQGLRDSVWKSNEREKQRRSAPDSPPVVPVNAPISTTALPFLPLQATATQNGGNSEVQQRHRPVLLPPSAYYKKTGDSKVELVWKNDRLSPSRARAPDSVAVPGDSVPLFSAAELAPTFHDGATGAVLGCPHYARACKLRHPKSGRLYTCRLCCDQARELPMIRGGSQEDERLDRYAVTEVMCMICNALQPAEDRCINPDCESYGRPFAKYFCRICHLYDGSSRPIFHCPYCTSCWSLCPWLSCISYFLKCFLFVSYRRQHL